MDPSLLFIYGTLLPGQEPDRLKAVCARLNMRGRAVLRGNLYDLGEFPGLVLNDGGEVHGVLAKVPGDLWPVLDDYENCPGPGLDDGLFLRVIASAQMDDGTEVPCWVYVYGRSVAGRAEIASGDWRHRDG